VVQHSSITSYDYLLNEDRIGNHMFALIVLLSLQLLALVVYAQDDFARKLLTHNAEGGGNFTSIYIVTKRGAKNWDELIMGGAWYIVHGVWCLVLGTCIVKLFTGLSTILPQPE
jgi:hypothetical protein